MRTSDLARNLLIACIIFFPKKINAAGTGR
jgi:hypothetical protein